MKIRIRRTRPRPSRYPLKPTSFLTSLTVHAALVSLLFGVTSGRPPRSTNRPLYETEIKPNEKKIVWYNFRETVPNLPATKKIGTAKNPQGKVVSPQIVIVTSKEATKSKQFIWQPTPQKKIEEEIKAPNLVAVKPAAPAPPEPKTAEAPRPPVESPKITAEPVKVEETLAAVKQPPRRFQPTPQQARPQIALQTPTIVDAPPEASVLGGSLPGVSSTTFSSSKIPPKRYVPPNMSRSNTGTGDNAAKAGIITAPAPELSNTGNVNMAIVGLHPSDLPLPAIPEGTLPGRFSTAPKAGKASTGNLPISASGIPNLVVEGGAKARSGSAEPAAPSIPKKTVLYRQVATGSIPSTLSAPLRPGNRRIPSVLEARFQGRNVYTMVLPAPNLPGYAGDWVLWFADRQVDLESTVQMRAPLPYRKKVTEQGSEQSGNSVMRVQIAGFVGKDGRLNELTILKGGGPGSGDAFLEDLKTWEFTPATRNLVPVDVEVVIEIAFRR
jgi:hypothetical protein